MLMVTFTDSVRESLKLKGEKPFLLSKITDFNLCTLQGFDYTFIHNSVINVHLWPCIKKHTVLMHSQTGPNIDGF